MAVVRTGEEEPPLDTLREALRDVVANCIYGVDINPLAVELCKVALWLESLDPRKPLGFLDHRIKCGNSIIGATPDLLKNGIPNEAFKPIEGDDTTIATSIRKRNKDERKGQLDLFTISESYSGWREAASAYTNWSSLPEDTLEQISEKARQYETMLDGRHVRFQHELADLWTSAFFWPLTEETCNIVPTHEVFCRYRDGAYLLNRKLGNFVRDLAAEHRFFHWHLEFPEVFMKQKGFDCVLGNPPWERIKLQEKEFFAQRDPEIANAPNAATRKRLILKLPETNPTLWSAFISAKRMAEGESHFLRTSGRYPLSAVGDLNTYQIFAGLFRELLSEKGRAGVIVPTGIATDDTNKQFFADLTEKKSLVSLYDFENREGIFPAVHRSYKFCLLTMGGPQTAPGGTDFVFFLTNAAQLHESDRHFRLSSEDIALLNPNTHTCPIFRSHRDADLTKEIYSFAVVLKKKGGERGWKIDFLKKMLDFTIHRNIIGEQRESGKVTMIDSGIELPTEICRPVYEAKMIHQFDHRYATYPEVVVQDIEAFQVTTNAKANLELTVTGRYWVSQKDFQNRVSDRPINFDAILSLRGIARTTDERTLIAAIRPLSPAFNSIGNLFVSSALEALFLCGCLNAFATDYVARQKLGGANLDPFIVFQLAVVDRNVIHRECEWDRSVSFSQWVSDRVLELTYTAWDLESFARDCGWTGSPFRWDEDRRFLLRSELDAAFFHLFLPATPEGHWKIARITDGAVRDDLLEEQAELRRNFPTPRDAVIYIMDTFPIVKRRDIAQFDEYRTKNLILQIYDAMQLAKNNKQIYQTILDPPPDYRLSHQPVRNE